jgi:DNA-binding transcriptional ArsR family regulator
MDAERIDALVAGIAASIGEPARARMLYCLLDGRARTSTELGMVGEVSPSTASVHLARLKDYRLVEVLAQGKHRYYRLKDSHVAQALEALSVVAGSGAHKFTPSTPSPLRHARTCYDHMAGEFAVQLHDRLQSVGWVRTADSTDPAIAAYEVSAAGATGLQRCGIDIAELRSSRRRFAYGCVDWSERRPHIAGALGGALLKMALQKKWVARETEGRGLKVTNLGRRELIKLG